MVKVSVIVPVYNGEKYLNQCLDSICAQTLREIEIICIDDGSTDASLDILKNYRRRDERVRIYQQSHLYVGVARNLGIKYATGEYLIFWDCDDFFEPNALECLYERAKTLSSDICICGINVFYNDKDFLEKNREDYFNKKRFPKEDIFNRISNPKYILNFTSITLWNKLFRRAFIGEKGIQFIDIRVGEDVYFVILASCQADTITTVNKALVTYRRNREGSLVNTLSESPTALYEALCSASKYLIKLNIFPEQSFVNKAVQEISYSLRTIKNHDAFVEAVQFLKNGALERMGINPYREETFYYVKWHKDLVDHLICDSVEDFQTFLITIEYQLLEDCILQRRLRTSELKNARGNIKKQEQTIDEIEKKLSSQRKNSEQLEVERDALVEANKNLLKETIVQKEYLNKCQEDLNAIKNSVSFRIGRIITWLPRWIRNFFRK